MGLQCCTMQMLFEDALYKWRFACVASVVWEWLSTSVSFGTVTVCAHGPVDAVEWDVV